MSLDYCFHEELNLIEVHPVGVVKIPDIATYAQEILARDLLTEGTIEYYDLSGMTNLEGNFSDAFGLSGLIRNWISRGWHGSVFFTPSQYQFGMIRMMGSIAENVLAAPSVAMIPRREPTALGDVRAVIADHVRIRDRGRGGELA